MTFHSTWTVTLPVALLGAGYLLYAAPGGLRALAQRVPPIRAALAGLAVLAVLGFALNDSGIAVPGMMLGVIVPALVVLAVRSEQVLAEPEGTDPTTTTNTCGSSCAREPRREHPAGVRVRCARGALLVARRAATSSRPRRCSGRTTGIGRCRRRRACSRCSPCSRWRRAGRRSARSGSATNRAATPPARSCCSRASGSGLLGFVDDVLGTGEDRGFKGHLRALATGRVTTGLCKIIGGVAVAFVLASQDDFITGKRLLSDAVLIALAANLGNLLDRAPGRVIKVGLVAWIPIAILAGTGAVGVAVAPVMGAFAGLLGDDLRERLMIGDTGANVIGAVLGLACVLEVGRGARNVILVVLVVLNVAAEFVSFSRVIERVPVLRALDHAGRRE